MQQWRIRYKGPRGVQIATVEAASYTEADAVGRAYVRAHGAERLVYIQIDGPAVVAGPEILQTGLPRDLPDDAEPTGEDLASAPSIPKPTLAQQRDRMAGRTRGGRTGNDVPVA